MVFDWLYCLTLQEANPKEARNIRAGASDIFILIMSSNPAKSRPSVFFGTSNPFRHVKFA
ncbi:MAG: hypothetical protein EBR09_14045 [Proteobacteria bacterium]|nr:hypothetical protein [Pseudomonadota bacterium]